MTRTRQIALVILEAFKLLIKRAHLYFIVAASLLGIFLVVQYGYYRYMPGNWFLHVNAVKVEDAQIGQDLSLTLCRTARYPDIKASSTRSYYQYVKGGKLIAAGEYEFKATYEADAHCQVIHIPPSRHPEKSGDYYVHTESTFYVADGRFHFKKVISYDSNRFHLYDTAKSLEDQIKGLQDQIDQLKRELTDSAVQSSARTSASVPASATPAAVAAPPTPQTQTPTTPAQTTSGSAGNTPPPPGLVTRTLKLIRGLL